MACAVVSSLQERDTPTELDPAVTQSLMSTTAETFPSMQVLWGLFWVGLGKLQPADAVFIGSCAHINGIPLKMVGIKSLLKSLQEDSDSEVKHLMGLLGLRLRLFDVEHWACEHRKFAEDNGRAWREDKALQKETRMVEFHKQKNHFRR